MNRYALEIVFAERHADGAYESCRRTVYAFSETEAMTALMEALSVDRGEWPTITGIVVMDTTQLAV